MDLYSGKAFVRKYSTSRGTGRPVTMILLLVDGDIPSLTDEALHALQITDMQGALTANIIETQPTEQYKGWRADQVLTAM